MGNELCTNCYENNHDTSLAVNIYYLTKIQISYHKSNKKKIIISSQNELSKNNKQKNKENKNQNQEDKIKKIYKKNQINKIIKAYRKYKQKIKIVKISTQGEEEENYVSK